MCTVFFIKFFGHALAFAILTLFFSFWRLSISLLFSYYILRISSNENRGLNSCIGWRSSDRFCSMSLTILRKLSFIYYCSLVISAALTSFYNGYTLSLKPHSSGNSSGISAIWYYFTLYINLSSRSSLESSISMSLILNPSSSAYDIISSRCY